MTTNRKLVIIGSGPAGLTAGIYAARAHLEPLIIEGKEPGGQLMGTTYIENWPGNRRILGPELMQNMRTHAQELLNGLSQAVTASDFSSGLALTTHKNQRIHSQAIIIATGARYKKLAVPENKSIGDVA